MYITLKFKNIRDKEKIIKFSGEERDRVHIKVIYLARI